MRLYTPSSLGTWFTSKHSGQMVPNIISQRVVLQLPKLQNLFHGSDDQILGSIHFNGVIHYFKTRFETPLDFLFPEHFTGSKIFAFYGLVSSSQRIGASSIHSPLDAIRLSRLQKLRQEWHDPEEIKLIEIIVLHLDFEARFVHCKPTGESVAVPTRGIPEQYFLKCEPLLLQSFTRIVEWALCFSRTPRDQSHWSPDRCPIRIGLHALCYVFVRPSRKHLCNTSTLAISTLLDCLSYISGCGWKFDEGPQMNYNLGYSPSQRVLGLYEPALPTNQWPWLLLLP